MIDYRRLIAISALCAITVMAVAQTSINSPYSRYGFGQLDDQGFGNSKAMGGIAYGLRDGYQINASNPASYTAIDSLTFLFDAGMSLQNANFKDGVVKTNAKNSSFDYVAMQFRLGKKMAMTIGLLPFSTVGYNMSTTNELAGSDEDGYWAETYTGDGGFHQFFVGLGYKVWNNLSVGVNLSYLYGDITHQATTSFSNTSATSSMRTEEFSLSDYKLDFGLQYTHRFNAKHVVNVGATYSLGHSMNGEARKYHRTVASSYVQTETGDTISSPFKMPHTVGVGVTYVYDNRLTIGVDCTMQKWETATLDWSKFDRATVEMNKRGKVAVGVEYTPNYFSRNYLNRIRYRAGAYYATPYTKVNGQDGPKEYGVSIGFGLPLFQSKSMLNISGQYVRVNAKASGMLEENYLRVNIGLTFNERWFMKWRVD